MQHLSSFAWFIKTTVIVHYIIGQWF